MRFKDYEAPTYRGVEGTMFISHGEWNDPEIVYEDRSFNYWDVEDALWDMYKEQGGNVKDEESFNEFCRENAIDVLDNLLPSAEEYDDPDPWAEKNKHKYVEDGSLAPYGKDEYEKIKDKLSTIQGMRISKRIVDKDKPYGLLTVAHKIGVDMWDLLDALEYMCYIGKAEEIDDSTYQIKENETPEEGEDLYEITYAYDEDEYGHPFYGRENFRGSWVGAKKRIEELKNSGCWDFDIEQIGWDAEDVNVEDTKVKDVQMKFYFVKKGTNTEDFSNAYGINIDTNEGKITSSRLTEITPFASKNEAINALKKVLKAQARTKQIDYHSSLKYFLDKYELKQVDIDAANEYKANDFNQRIGKMLRTFSNKDEDSVIYSVNTGKYLKYSGDIEDPIDRVTFTDADKFSERDVKRILNLLENNITDENFKVFYASDITAEIKRRTELRNELSNLSTSDGIYAFEFNGKLMTNENETNPQILTFNDKNVDKAVAILRDKLKKTNFKVVNYRQEKPDDEEKSKTVEEPKVEYVLKHLDADGKERGKNTYYVFKEDGTFDGNALQQTATKFESVDEAKAHRVEIQKKFSGANIGIYKLSTASKKDSLVSDADLDCTITYRNADGEECTTSCLREQVEEMKQKMSDKGYEIVNVSCEDSAIRDGKPKYVIYNTRYDCYYKFDNKGNHKWVNKPFFATKFNDVQDAKAAGMKLIDKSEINNDRVEIKTYNFFDRLKNGAIDFFNLDKEKSSSDDTYSGDVGTTYIIRHGKNFLCKPGKDTNEISSAKKFNTNKEAEDYIEKENLDSSYTVDFVHDSKCKDSAIKYKGYRIVKDSTKNYSIYLKDEYVDSGYESVKEAIKDIDKLK